jgi:hypothetical protein
MNRYLSTCLCLSLLTFACGGGGSNDDTNDNPPDAAGNLPPTAFRVTAMQLMDPHTFAFGNDVTGLVDDSIASSIEEDGDDPADNLLDLNLAIVFKPLQQSASTSPVDITFPECTAPLETTACTQTTNTQVIAATATNTDGECLGAIAGTVTPYNPPVMTVPASCFQTSEIDVTVSLGTVTLPLKDAQISATYSGDPATTLTTGLLRGFVTKADADVILLPDSLPVVGGNPLSTVLKPEDMDTNDNVDGWWFYLSLEAAVVDYTIEE